MSKVLEAFEKLEKHNCHYCQEHFDGKCNRDNDDYDGEECIINVLRKEIEVIEKELKALEIIKNKRVDVAIFFENNNSSRHREPLTKEEHDLLKEVLL